MLFEVIAVVDDGILEVALAARFLTLPSSVMIILLLGAADGEVLHVLLLALLAEFEVCVAMKLRHVFRFEPTLAM